MADRALLEQWRLQGDADSFRMLTERYAAMVYSTGLRILRHAQDAEDVTQLAFEKLARLPNAPRGSLGAWLHRVVTNQALDLLKSRRRSVKRDAAYADTKTTHGEVEWDDIYEYVDAAIAELPRDVREAVIAHFLFNRTHDDIAREAGVSRAAVTQRIHRGLDSIRGALRRRGVPLTSAALLGLLERNVAEAAMVPASLTATLGKMALSSYATGGALRGAVTWPMWAGVAVVAVVVAGIVGISTYRTNIVGRTSQPASTLQAVQATLPPVNVATQQEREDFARSPETSRAPASAPSISGLVTDAESGLGVAGATVRAMGRGDRNLEVESTTDANGSYTMPGVSAATYIVMVSRAPEHLGVSLLTDEEYKQHIREVVIGPATSVENVDFALSRSVSIAGSVVDENGKPVAAGHVFCIAKNVSMQPMEAETGAKGVFLVSGFPPTAQFVVWGEAPGLTCAPMGPLIVTKDGLHDVVVTLQPESRISGRAIESDGKPLQGYKVVTQGADRIHDVAHEANTNAEGAFELAGLPAGAYFLKLLSEDGIHILNNDPSAVPVGVGEHVTDIELVSTRGKAFIAGVVVNIKGEPVSKAEIEGGDARAESGADGKFVLENLSRESYTLRVTRFPYTPSTVTAAAGDKNVVVKLEPIGVFEGRAIDAKTGAPIPELLAEWFPKDYRWPFDQRYEPRPTNKGRFQATGPAGEEGEVGIRARGYRTHREPVTLTPGNNPEVQIRLVPQADLRGVVVAPRGPAADAFLFMGPIPNIVEYLDKKAVARTDDEGSFVIPASAVFGDSLQVFHPDFAPATLTLSDDELNGDSSISVTLVEGGVLEGTVTSAGAVDKRIITNVFSGAEFPIDSEVIDGKYRLEKLAPGPVQVFFLFMLESGGPMYYRKYFEEAEIVSGETTEVSHDFPAGTATIQGKIEGASAEGVQLRCCVDTQSGLESVYTQDAFLTGEYLLHDVPAGTVSLAASTYMNGKAHSRFFQFAVSDGAVTVQDIAFNDGVNVRGHVAGSTANEVRMVAGHYGPDLDFSRDDTGISRIMYTRARVADGTFMFANAAPGQYTLIAVQSPGRDEVGDTRFGAPIHVEVAMGSDLEVKEVLSSP